jgi:catechol 2,3-dioxygenase-like lactoylglutathione lyase family enzyme
MAIELNHTIVPAYDKELSAQFFSAVFGLKYAGSTGHFAALRVNETLTFDFENVKSFERHHYGFLVSDREFEDILQRVKERNIVYGSDPWHLDDRQLNQWNGGRGFYFRDVNGHLFELLTRKECNDGAMKEDT